MANEIGGPKDGPIRPADLPPFLADMLRNTMKERKNLFTEVEPEIRDGGDLLDVPVIVLAAMGIDPY